MSSCLAASSNGTHSPDADRPLFCGGRPHNDRGTDGVGTGACKERQGCGSQNVQVCNYSLPSTDCTREADSVQARNRQARGMQVGP